MLYKQTHDIHKLLRWSWKMTGSLMEKLKGIDEDFWIEKVSLVLIYGTCKTAIWFALSIIANYLLNSADL